jgi:hypothetical protein
MPTVKGGLLLEGFRHVPGTDAAGADLDAPHGAFVDGLDLLQVGVPGPAGLVIGVADVVTEARFLAAYFTYFRHGIAPLGVTEASIYNKMGNELQEKFTLYRYGRG